MSETPNRRFWQIHLSTAMVLLLIVAGFIGINVNSPRYEVLDDAAASFRPANNEKLKLLHISGGWPIRSDRSIPVPASVRPDTEMSTDPSEHITFERFERWCGLECAVNSAPYNGSLLIGLLLAVALVSESLIRRREGRPI